MNIFNDFLARLRNGYSRGLPTIIVRRNNLVIAFLKVLYRYGFISNFSILSQYTILVNLKYSEGKPALREIKSISRPGNRIYISYRTLRSMRKRYLGQKVGFIILTTNNGLLSDTEALMQRKGGEALALVI